jgi:hypothetical protein
MQPSNKPGGGAGNTFNGRPSEELSTRIGVAGSNMRPGDFCASGIYVVSHRNPDHAVPHEILIASDRVLPRCSDCDEVRFSFKCALTARIEDSRFFGFESVAFAVRVRMEAQELRNCAERSRELLAKSALFLAALDKSLYYDGLIPRSAS